MKLSSSFVVPAGPERVFAHFLDPSTMRVAIPGCAELTRTDERNYRGTLVNEIAHVRFSAGFSAEITELREPSEVRAVLKGEDRRLGSSIRIDALLTVCGEDGGDDEDGAGETAAESARVDYRLDMAIRGKIGRLGESIVRRRSQEVERQFAATFGELCAAGPPGADSASDGPAYEPAHDREPTTTDAVTIDAATTDAAPVRQPWWRRLVALFAGRRS